jgi:hypothetical protein
VRVFVLCTGRCGSVTLAEALKPAANYTVGHETRWGQVLPHRIDFPDDHIEIDNRFAWLLGSLGERYPDALYVHLTRDRTKVAKSFNRRWSNATMRGYRALTGLAEGLPTAVDYVEVVNGNIRHFLRDKDSLAVELGSDEDFRGLWLRLGADGDMDEALALWNQIHNSQPSGRQHV